MEKKEICEIYIYGLRSSLFIAHYTTMRCHEVCAAGREGVVYREPTAWSLISFDINTGTSNEKRSVEFMAQLGYTYALSIVDTG